MKDKIVTTISEEDNSVTVSFLSTSIVSQFENIDDAKAFANSLYLAVSKDKYLGSYYLEIRSKVNKNFCMELTVGYKTKEMAAKAIKTK